MDTYHSVHIQNKLPSTLISIFEMESCMHMVTQFFEIKKKKWIVMKVLSDLAWIQVTDKKCFLYIFVIQVRHHWILLQKNPCKNMRRDCNRCFKGSESSILYFCSVNGNNIHWQYVALSIQFRHKKCSLWIYNFFV